MKYTCVLISIAHFIIKYLNDQKAIFLTKRKSHKTKTCEINKLYRIHKQNKKKLMGIIPIV